MPSAKKEFESYKNFLVDIKEYEAQLAEIRNGNTITIAAKNDGIPQKNNCCSDTTFAQASYNIYSEQKTIHRINNLRRKIDLLEEAINSVAEPNQRTALWKKYIRGKSYTTLSYEMEINRHQAYILVQKGICEATKHLIDNNYWE